MGIEPVEDNIQVEVLAKKWQGECKKRFAHWYRIFYYT